jgi:protein-disulfide isomerase
VDSSSLTQVRADDITLGSPEAPITMIEYASLGCPHCAEFNETIFPQIKANYIDKGHVLYVFRDWAHHPAFLQATQLTSCMPRESYLSFVDMLFRNQGLWAQADMKEGLITMGRRAGMTREQVETCLNDEAKRTAIAERWQQMTREVEQLGLRGVPSFFVNGRRVDAVSYQDFDRLFKGLLPQLGAQTTQAPGEGEAPASTSEPNTSEPESDTTPPTP